MDYKTCSPMMAEAGVLDETNRFARLYWFWETSQNTGKEGDVYEEEK